MPETQAALANSSLIASLATLLALLVGTPAAYALARFRFKLVANRDITIFFFAERVLPPVAIVIPFYLVMRSLGLLDTHLALILVNATFIMPFVVVILRQAFLDLPVELEEIRADRRRRPLGRVLAHRTAAGRPGDRRHRPDHLRPRLERVPVRARDLGQGRDHDPGPHGRHRRHPRRPVLVPRGPPDDRDPAARS